MMRLLAWMMAFATIGSAVSADEASVVCAAAPTPVISLDYVSRYSDDDAHRATIDPQREAEAEAAVAPVDDFILMLAEGIDEMYSSPIRKRPELASCVLRQLAHWAEKDALAELRTETVRLTVGARYAALSLVLWQTLPYAHEHPARDLIAAWLDRRVQEQMVFWAEAGEGSRRGNLRAWAGLAAASLGIQTGDAKMMDWAEVSISHVMCSANPDGSLPQEMRRGPLALHYQLHAIAPLVTASALLEREGRSVSNQCDKALHRIVSFAVDDLDDGERTREITGVAQNLIDGRETLKPFQMAWIESYLWLRRDEELAELATQMRPLSYSKLGGNQTALWGN